MKQPALKDKAFLANVRAGAHRHDGTFRLWWLGQSGFLLQWNGRHILFDPYLSDSLTLKYDGSDRPHVRVTERVVDPAELGFVDFVCASHSHTDHMDPDTLAPLLRTNRGMRIVVPAACRQIASQRLPGWDASLVTVDDGSTVALSDFRITGIASAHERVEHDAEGRCRFLGYIAQFGDWKLYHCGDTVLYEGLAERLTPYRVNVALLPINGRPGSVPGNLTGEEAAWLGRAMVARTVIPCHYDMFEFNTADPGDFARAARTLGQSFRILQYGERWESESPAAIPSPEQVGQ